MNRFLWQASLDGQVLSKSTFNNFDDQATQFQTFPAPFTVGGPNANNPATAGSRPLREQLPVAGGVALKARPLRDLRPKP